MRGSTPLKHDVTLHVEVANQLGRSCGVQRPRIHLYCLADGSGDMGQVLFLNYHSLDIGKQAAPYHVDPEYSVTRVAFAAQLRLISDLKVPVLSLARYLEQLASKTPFAANSLVITFDDGFVTDHEAAYPLLAEHGFPAAFFVCLLNIKSESRWPELRQMLASGHELGSHTITHRYLSDLSALELEHELSASKRIIEDKTGQRVRYLAPPGGRYDAAVTRAARRLGYEALLTTRVGVNDHTADAMALKRWSVRYHTPLSEFESMILQRPGALRKKQLKSRALNLMKGLLGNRAFDQLRSVLLAARP
jgi:peptidoglycan/xylan/chitin deacetylase (PgdA/CDA1 family)